MQIVIEIDAERYKWIVDNPQTYTDEIHDAIRNGTPLPKGHGSLIYAEKIDFSPLPLKVGDSIDFDDLKKLINDEPIIIEADKEADDADSD